MTATSTHEDTTLAGFGADLHCSLGDGRSYTDPVTNWTLISGVKLDRDLGHMIQAGRYPRAFLADFIHELVHHSCFYSSVGTALALLQLRARRRSVVEEDTWDETNDARWDVLEDVVRYETAISHMRPLAEGLALYGEFDALPGKSPVISHIMLMTGISFLDLRNEKRSEELSVAEATERLASVLVSARLGETFQRRKGNLLARPLDTAGGGYLPGYLTVKNIWHALVAQTQCAKLFDTDLYMNYLRTFFYDDYAYIATLLDPDKEISAAGGGRNDSAQAISTYFQERIYRLFEYTNEKTITEFEEMALAGQTVPEMGSDPALAQRGRELLDEMLAELDFDGPPDTREKLLLRRDQWTLAQRELMCVGSFVTPVAVNVHGRVAVGEFPLGPADVRIPVFSLPALPDWSVDSGEGSVEFFLSPAGRYSVFTVTLHHKVVAIGSLSPNLSDEVKEQICGYKTSHSQAAEERGIWHAVLESILNEKTPHWDYLTHYRKEARRVADAVYLPKALALTPDDRLEAAIAVLSKDGFYQLLGRDFDAVMGAARLSLATSVTFSRNTVEQLVGRDGTDMDFVLAAIRNAEQATAVKLLQEDGPVISCLF
jgi:hypothetical protein